MLSIFRAAGCPVPNAVHACPDCGEPRPWMQALGLLASRNDSKMAEGGRFLSNRHIRIRSGSSIPTGGSSGQAGLKIELGAVEEHASAQEVDGAGYGAVATCSGLGHLRAKATAKKILGVRLRRAFFQSSQAARRCGDRRSVRVDAQSAASAGCGRSRDARAIGSKRPLIQCGQVGFKVRRRCRSDPVEGCFATMASVGSGFGSWTPRHHGVRPFLSHQALAFTHGMSPRWEADYQSSNVCPAPSAPTSVLASVPDVDLAVESPRPSLHGSPVDLVFEDEGVSCVPAQ